MMGRPSTAASSAATAVSSVGGYSTRDVAALLGLSPEQVRAYVRAGVLAPRQGARGEYLFSFQDLILLRAAKGLLAAQIPHRRIVSALENLQKQLPAGRPLTGVRITAEGHQVVVRDGGEVWNPDSGQKLLDFGIDDLRREAANLAERAERAEQAEREASRRAAFPGDRTAEEELPEQRMEPQDAEGWFIRGEDLEPEDAAEALAAYRRALELDPGHADAHLNLGRLLHDKGDAAAAETHYRQALEVRPGPVTEATAAYNLGVALQDLERLSEAAEAYETALRADPGLADAHFNVAGVYELLGQGKSALRHLKAYRSLIQKR